MEIVRTIVNAKAYNNLSKQSVIVGCAASVREGKSSTASRGIVISLSYLNIASWDRKRQFGYISDLPGLHLVIFPFIEARQISNSLLDRREGEEIFADEVLFVR
jgi:hypothetical protein